MCCDNNNCPLQKEFEWIKSQIESIKGKLTFAPQEKEPGWDQK